MTIPLNTNDPLRRTLEWMSTHAAFPGSRLEPRAEALLCLAAVAVAAHPLESEAGRPRGAASFDRAALRAHTLNRAHARTHCDNSTKV